jgi:hypothetical protein
MVMLSRRRFIQSAAAVGALAPFISFPTRADEVPLDIADEPQLFLDDWLIDRSTNLTRTLHPPKKHGLIKNADGSDWERGDVYMGNIVCRDDSGRFHMTYRYMWDDPGVKSLHPNIGDDKAHWYRQSTAYATSADGIQWEKPDLGLVDGPARFRRNAEYPFLTPTCITKHNNLGCPFDFIYDLHSHGNTHEPGKRFLVRTGRLDDTHPFAELKEVKLWYAPDWPDFARDRFWMKKLTPIEGANISPRGFKTMAGYDHAAKMWFAVSQDSLARWIPRGGRDVARYASPDLIHWTGPQLVLPVAQDESKRPDDYVEYMDLLAYRVGGPKSGAWLGQLLVFHSDRTSRQYGTPTIDNVWRKGLTEIRLVISRDAGKSWQRVCGKQVWLPHHAEPHGFDRLVFGSPPINVGDESWLYYGAWDGDHLIFNRDGTLFEKGFARTGRTARASFRRDGYVSLDAKEGTSAELVTKLLNVRGKELRLNLSSPKAEVRVELQDDAGKPLGGFAASECISVTGNHLAKTVAWKSEQKLPTDAPMRLRFSLRGDASLYGFRFSEDGV